MQNTYLVIGRDKEGHKIKITLEDILIDEEDMRPAEKYGPEFINASKTAHYIKPNCFGVHK
jgi:hypothetical protein